MGASQKVAIVTGSTSGIGKAIAKTFLKEGMKVVITGLDEAEGKRMVEEATTSGAEAMYIFEDLRDPSGPSRIVAKTVDRWKALDIVVNNAGAVCNKSIDRISHDDWDALFQINLKAPFFMVQHALPWLRAAHGVIVNVSSINAIRNDVGNLVYDTMKAGLNQMTTGLALDLKSDGIRCNAVMPGGIGTPLLAQWMKQKLGDDKAAKERFDDELRSNTLGTTQQIADVVKFLVSEDASWVNGALIPVDGGAYLGPNSD